MKPSNIVTGKFSPEAQAGARSKAGQTPKPGQAPKTSQAPKTGQAPKIVRTSQEGPRAKSVSTRKSSPILKSGLIDQAPAPSRVSSDFALGAFGCGLAVASASFGLYMNVHGPAPHQPGNDFSVFAQLAPRATPAGKPSDAEPLDLTPTASIRRSPAAAPPPREPGMDAMVLQSATAESATISVDGRALSVRVGDVLPGGGEVLAIYPGRRPLVKTSRGTIVATGGE